MINAELAQRLKRAGLEWRPSERDAFAIPGHQLDGQTYIVSPLPALVQLLHGEPTITFHGSIEWALDYVLLTEVVWLPNESQLREELDRRANADAPLLLERKHASYRCQFSYAGQSLSFEAATAEDSYAQGLLYILEQQAS